MSAHISKNVIYLKRFRYAHDPQGVHELLLTEGVNRICFWEEESVNHTPDDEEVSLVLLWHMPLYQKNQAIERAVTHVIMAPKQVA